MHKEFDIEYEKSKYPILKFIFIIVLMSADISKEINIDNINFYLILVVCFALFILYSMPKEKIVLSYLKSEKNIYISVFILSFFIVLYAWEWNSLIHAVKLFIIFYIIYPTIRNFFTTNQLIISLKVNLVVNFVFIMLGEIGLSIMARFTGVLRGSTILNYAGSLYKVGLVLVPYILYDIINQNKHKLLNLILLIICVYIIFYDGSRTGIFSLIIIFILFLIYLMHKFFKEHKISLILFFRIFLLILLVGIILFLNRNKIRSSNAFIRAHSTIKIFFSMNFYDFLLNADSIRGYMILDGIKTIKDNYLLLGHGFQTTKTNNIVLHNAYLQVFADLGLIAMISLVIIIFNPIIIGIKKFKNRESILPSIILLIIFSFLLLLHPLSVQVSDWALYIIPLSIMMNNINENKKVNVFLNLKDDG